MINGHNYEYTFYEYTIYVVCMRNVHTRQSIHIYSLAQSIIILKDFMATHKLRRDEWKAFFERVQRSPKFVLYDFLSLFFPFHFYCVHFSWFFSGAAKSDIDVVMWCRHRSSIAFGNGAKERVLHANEQFRMYDGRRSNSPTKGSGKILCEVANQVKDLGYKRGMDGVVSDWYLVATMVHDIDSTEERQKKRNFRYWIMRRNKCEMWYFLHVLFIADYGQP